LNSFRHFNSEPTKIYEINIYVSFMNGIRPAVGLADVNKAALNVNSAWMD